MAASFFQRMRNQRMFPFYRTVATEFFLLASWIPVVAWVNMHVAQLTYVTGPSMYPLINSDKDSTLNRDVVLNWKLNAQEDLERGMVVTLRSPLHPENMAVKRVVALEGDIIKTKHPYPVSTVRVPVGHCWVEGDGAPGSTLDSNTYGPVSLRLLTGRITHVVYPFTKFGALDWRDHERPLVP